MALEYEVLTPTTSTATMAAPTTSIVGSTVYETYTVEPASAVSS